MFTYTFDFYYQNLVTALHYSSFAVYYRLTDKHSVTQILIRLSLVWSHTVGLSSVRPLPGFKCAVCVCSLTLSMISDWYEKNLSGLQ